MVAPSRGSPEAQSTWTNQQCIHRRPRHREWRPGEAARWCYRGARHEIEGSEHQPLRHWRSRGTSNVARLRGVVCSNNVTGWRRSVVLRGGEWHRNRCSLTAERCHATLAPEDQGGNAIMRVSDSLIIASDRSRSQPRRHAGVVREQRAHAQFVERHVHGQRSTWSAVTFRFTISTKPPLHGGGFFVPRDLLEVAGHVENHVDVAVRVEDGEVACRRGEADDGAVGQRGSVC